MRPIGPREGFQKLSKPPNLFVPEDTTGTNAEFPWSRLTPTIHRLLCHTIHIQMVLKVPVGRMSEEVIEAYNNLLKNVFRSHTFRGDAYGDVAIAQHSGYKEIKIQEPPARVKYLFREFKNTKRKRRIE